MGMAWLAWQVPCMHTQPQRPTPRWSIMANHDTTHKLDGPGIGFETTADGVLTYSDLTQHLPRPGCVANQVAPSSCNLTGHMEKFSWSFDGIKSLTRASAPPSTERASFASRCTSRHLMAFTRSSLHGSVE